MIIEDRQFGMHRFLKPLVMIFSSESQFHLFFMFMQLFSVLNSDLDVKGMAGRCFQPGESPIVGLYPVIVKTFRCEL